MRGRGVARGRVPIVDSMARRTHLSVQRGDDLATGGVLGGHALMPPFAAATIPPASRCARRRSASNACAMISSSSVSATAEATLTAGSHVLEIAHRENILKMDRLLVTDDLAFVAAMQSRPLDRGQGHWG
jgi:hypothetical protein